MLLSPPSTAAHHVTPRRYAARLRYAINATRFRQAVPLRGAPRSRYVRYAARLVAEGDQLFGVLAQHGLGEADVRRALAHEGQVELAVAQQRVVLEELVELALRDACNARNVWSVRVTSATRGMCAACVLEARVELAQRLAARFGSCACGVPS